MIYMVSALSGGLAHYYLGPFNTVGLGSSGMYVFGSQTMYPYRVFMAAVWEKAFMSQAMDCVRTLVHSMPCCTCADVVRQLLGSFYTCINCSCITHTVRVVQTDRDLLQLPCPLHSGCSMRGCAHVVLACRCCDGAVLLLHRVQAGQPLHRGLHLP